MKTPVALFCKKCGQVFGVAFTLIQPAVTPLVAACIKCTSDAMCGKPAATDAEWSEVQKKL